jgi:hypothetical protein
MNGSAVLVAAIGIAACSHRPYIEPVPPNGIAIKSAQLGMYHKEVVTKKDPDTLFAPEARCAELHLTCISRRRCTA